MTEQSAPRSEEVPTQTVDVVVHHGYAPDLIRARAGIPLRIRFRRIDDDPCTARVVFSSPHLERRLAGNATTAIDLPAQPAGEIRFTCGMGRYRARIELIDDARGIGSMVRAALGWLAGTLRPTT